MGVLEVPHHDVNIKSSLINGNIVIGMRPSLIFGNDLAGEKAMVDPRVVEKPRDDVKTDLPMSGQLEIRKTYNSLLQHFYWPGLKRDVAKWCKECHTCQLGGKPNQNIPKAVLYPIPAFD